MSEEDLTGKAGLGQLMKQAQQMQQNIQRAQQDLANLRVTGVAGDGDSGTLVKVLMSGRYDVLRVAISRSLFTGKGPASTVDEAKEMTEDLVAAAINDAVRKVEQASKQKMSSLMSGFEMPPGMQMPFQAEE